MSTLTDCFDSCFADFLPSDPNVAKYAGAEPGDPKVWDKTGDGCMPNHLR